MLHLRLFVCNRVPKDKAASLGRMAVKIHVDVQSLLAVLMHYSSLGSVDCRVSHWVGLSVHSIQIEALSVVSPVASLYSIRVQQRDNLEDKSVEQLFGLHLVLCQEIKHTLQEERGNCFTAVNT